MRLIYLLVSFSITVLLSSCLSDNSVLCRSETNYRNLEFYVSEAGGQQYLTSAVDSTSGMLSLCNSIEFHDSTAYEGIFGIAGILVDMCDKGICFIVSDVSEPYCVPEYEVIEGDTLEFDGQWSVAYLYENTTKMYPSCSHGNTQLSFVQEADTSYVLGNFGPSDVSFGFSVLKDSLLVPSTDVTTRNTQGGFPYAQLFENALVDYFENIDTIYFSIENNELTLQNRDGDNGIVFYQ